MAKKNLPHIPLYIGDWEKDCNVLTLQTEAAWLRIIFKMFTNGKQSFYKVSTKGLQNLWRVSESDVEDIIEELEDNNICEIEREGRFILFTSRRYSKENEISKIRSEAVSKRKDRQKKEEEPLQNSYKSLQIADNDNDNSNTEVYSETDFIENWAKCRKAYLNKPTHFKKLEFYESTNFQQAIKKHGRENINKAMLGLFKQEQINIASMVLKPKHFLESIDKYLEAELSQTYNLYGSKPKQIQY